jgi:aromatic-L-amino-acid decarboxylase
LTNHNTRFRKAGYDAIDRICAYYYSLREKPVVAQVKPGYLRDLIPGMSVRNKSTVVFSIHSDFVPESAPQKGQEWTSIVDDYQNIIVPGMASISVDVNRFNRNSTRVIPGFTHWQHPSFFAYFPTSSTFEGTLGDLLSTSTANPGFNVRLETRHKM